MRHRRSTLSRAIREAGFSSVSSFARKLGMNQSTVSGWVSGSINPSEGQAQRAADALLWENSLEELFSMDGD